ncbi:MAG: PQQ-dependent sugar dehydrogenase, partial [Burkholderiales bacterium]|nr:PQQ-dependent sugar dehydrogenase [Phycisphaerae bacterium]
MNTRHNRTTGAPRNHCLTQAAIETLEARQLLASVTATTPYNGQQTVGLSANLTVKFGSAMNVSSLTAANIRLFDSAGLTLPTTLSYNAANTTLTIDPAANLLSTSAYYTLKVIGGDSGVKDSLNGTLAADYAASFTTSTPTFSETAVFTNLIQPTAIEFAEDGRIFVAEKRGIIKVFDSLGDTTPEIFADLRTQVHNYWDRGLLGMALDPYFTEGRPYVYVLYTFDGDVGGTAPKWGTANTDSDPGASNGTSTVSGRLTKLTASGNQMSGSEQVLVHDWKNQYPSHSIGDLKFGPDGYLYASGGDGASFNAIDYGQSNVFNDPANEGGALRSQDIRSTGDAVNLDGTVIRIHPDTGVAAPNNPFAANADANAKRIVAYGLRNPFRIAFRPGSSEIWIAETGWNSYEEINRIANGADTTAENFGWPAYEGPVAQPVYDAQNLPLLESLYAAGAGAVNTPWFSYAHSAKVVPGSTETTGGSTPTGLLFYTGGAMPAAYDNAFFFTDYARKQIYVMYRGVDGLPDQSTRQIFRSTTNGAVELQQGPDGAIYHVDLNGGRVMRIASGTGTSAPITPKLTGTFIGTANSGSNVPSRAFDGNLSTFYESSSASGGWVGLDLGSPRWIRQIKYAPRDTFGSRMVGGKFQGSNDPNFASGVVDLFTITQSPGFSLHSMTVNTSGNSYRYVRYLSPAGGWTDISELEFYAGDGLAATYHNNINFTGTTVAQIDPTINFDWGDGSPDALITSDTFSAQWTGKIQALETGTYTFRTTSDDGIRLWMNDVLLVDAFIDQAPTSYSNTIDLAAGGLYNIRIDYYENGGGASAKLEWQRPGKAMETVPTHVLFSSAPVSNQAPVPAIATPSSSLNWKVGDTISFSGSATDPDSGALPASSLLWSLVVVHANDIDLTSTHEHVVQTFIGVSSGSFIAPDHEYPSWIELRLTAVDSSNASASVTRRIDPLTAAVTLASNPAGAGLSFGSVAGAAPLVRTLIAGSITTISAPAQYVSGGQTYFFTGWSDGGALTHDIAAPLTNATITANYALPAAPAAPSNLVATPISTSQVNLAWTDNATNESGYKIERRIGAGAWTPVTTTLANVTTYSDAGLLAGTAYEYRVRATGAGGDSADSNIATATTASAVVVPAAATGLVAANVTTSTLTLMWTDNANNETGYRVQRRLSGGTYASIATLAANATSFADSGLTIGTAYDYRVYAFNAAGDSPASVPLTVTTQSGSSVPAAPGSLAANVVAGPQVQLTWADLSNNETGFTIQRRYAGWIWGDVGTAAANAVAFVDTSAIGNVTYEYRVMAT